MKTMIPSILLECLLIVLLVNVTPSSAVTPSCSEGDLQLDTSDPPLVLMCKEGQWGYVCAREDRSSPWGPENVGVACQQLGFIKEDVTIKELDDPISDTLPVHYRFVYCTGVERRLIDCARHESPTNGHRACRVMGDEYKYGAVACSEQSVDCEAGELKIINNALLICSQGEWYTLCGDTDSWTQAQARVACRQMGLNPNGAEAGIQTVPQPNSKVLSVIFHCVGDEDSLLDCSSSIIECDTSNTHMAAIQCGDPTNPPQNVSATSENQIVTISWDYDDNDAMFRITCGKGQITLSTTVNGTTEVTLNGIKLSPDTQYECCVTAVTLSGESERICDMITIEDISIVTSSSGSSSSSNAMSSFSTVLGTRNGFTTSDMISTSESSFIHSSMAGSSSLSVTGGTISISEGSFIHGPIATSSSPLVTDNPGRSAVSSTLSSPLPWSIGLLIGIVIGATVIIIVWIGQTLVCRKRRSYSTKCEAVELAKQADASEAISNPTYGSQPTTSTTATLASQSRYTEPAHQTGLPYEPIYTDTDTDTDKDNIYSMATDNNLYYSEASRGDVSDYCVPVSSEEQECNI